MNGKIVIGILTTVLGLLILAVSYSQFIFMGYDIRANGYNRNREESGNKPGSFMEILNNNPMRPIGIAISTAVGLGMGIGGVLLVVKQFK